MPLLEARELRKTYATGGVAVEALRGLSLRVDAGEFVAVMGPSGCGKSTLLHLLGGLDTPTSGEVLLDGRALGTLDESGLDAVRRTRVGIVFQFFNLVPVLSVAENVALPASIAGMPPEQRADRVAGLLDAVGLGGEREKLPSELSGGEQQRVAVARALVNRPAILLADEPTGNLDRRTGRDLMTLLSSLNASGQTLVVVTHDPNVAQFARRVVLLRDGMLFDDLAMDGDAGLGPLLDALAKLEADG